MSFYLSFVPSMQTFGEGSIHGNAALRVHSKITTKRLHIQTNAVQRIIRWFYNNSFDIKGKKTVTSRTHRGHKRERERERERERNRTKAKKTT